MRDYSKELENRVQFIKNLIKNANANGIVYGNSGGKDSALVGILCKMACDNTLGVIMPCQSKRNLGEDLEDGKAVAKQFSIDTVVYDLSDIKSQYTNMLPNLSNNASANIAPRLRMITLYAIAANENRLVAGTGNKSEAYMGYFTKWGDGAYDFNPIADLTVTEIYEFLAFLNAPQSIIRKAPSAGLFEGQTDESEMGITYKRIDEYINGGKVSVAEEDIIKKYHFRSEHKRKMPITYGGNYED